MDNTMYISYIPTNVKNMFLLVTFGPDPEMLVLCVVHSDTDYIKRYLNSLFNTFKTLSAGAIYIYSFLILNTIKLVICQMIRYRPSYTQIFLKYCRNTHTYLLHKVLCRSRRLFEMALFFFVTKKEDFLCTTCLFHVDFALVEIA